MISGRGRTAVMLAWMLALLPLASGECSIVWSMIDARVDELMNCTPEAFSAALTDAILRARLPIEIFTLDAKISANAPAAYHGLDRFVARKRVVADLEKMVDTTDEWILQRTGIESRTVAGPGQDVVSMAVQAARLALDDAAAALIAAAPSSDVAVPITIAPSLPRSSAMARPSLRAAPVTSAVAWFCISGMMGAM